MAMAAVPESQDEEIIKELVALQEVPVMAKLQSLLRSVCTRLTLQGSRIEKAEEQGRLAALLKDEFEHLSKNALEDLRAEKEADKNNWLKLLDDKLKGFEIMAKQYGDVVAAFQGVDLSILQSLPHRLSALEEKTPGLQEAKSEEKPSSVIDGNGLPDEDTASDGPTHQLQQLPPFDKRMENLEAEFDDQNNKISRLEEQIKELKGTMLDAAKAYSSDIESLQKICRNLRSDIEMLPILDMSPPQENEQSLVPANPNYTVSLSEIQNRLQRKADNETVDHALRSTAQAKEGLEKLKLVVDELKHQMRSAAPLASRRASTTMQASPMGGTTTESTHQKEMELDPKIISEIIVEEKVVKSVDGGLADGRLKHLENELVNLATQLAGKADRKDLNGLQIQMTLLEEQHPDRLSSSLATFSPDGVLMETSPGQDFKESKPDQNNLNEEKNIKLSDQLLEQRSNLAVPQQASQHEIPILDTVPSNEFQKLKSTSVALQISLQKLQELISQKADRDELLQLHQSVYRQKSDGPNPQLASQLPPVFSPQLAPNGGGHFEHEHYQPMYKALMLEMENMNNKMKQLEERSDLNVLITKRLENFTQPAATVPETSQGLNEVKAAINEHADRMMEYADTLLQMEALLATKADAAGLQVLRQSILELKKKSKEHSLDLRASSVPQVKQGEKPSQYITSAEKVEKHEMMLSKLLKDMELLGAGILTLSGHNHGKTKGAETQQTSPGAEELLGHNHSSIKGSEIQQTRPTAEALLGHNHTNTQGFEAQQTSPVAEGILESKAQHLESSTVAAPLTKKHEIHSTESKASHLESSTVAAPLAKKHEIHSAEAGGKADTALKDFAHAHDTKEHESKIGDKRMEQTVTEPEAGDKTLEQAVTKLEAGTKAAEHHDTFLELEEALHENLIKPKGDAEIVNKLAENFLPLSIKMNEFNDTLRALQDNTAEKDELQKMKTYLKQRLDRAETAMFSGKGLPGFKCMSCAHRLEKLNPNRADFVPTNSMRRQVLPMLAAERLYHKDGEMESPRALGTTSPLCENQSKNFPTNSMQLLSPGPLEAQEGQYPPSGMKPKAAKKK